jgi:hypothetical protein
LYIRAAACAAEFAGTLCAARLARVSPIFIREPRELQQLTQGAPAFAVFEKECTLLTRSPHLMLYWLSHHAFAGNREAWEKTRRLAWRSKNALVHSRARGLR